MLRRRTPKGLSTWGAWTAIFMRSMPRREKRSRVFQAARSREAKQRLGAHGRAQIQWPDALLLELARSTDRGDGTPVQHRCDLLDAPGDERGGVFRKHRRKFVCDRLATIRS